MTYPNDPDSPRRDPYPNADEPIDRLDPRDQQGHVAGRKVESDRLFVEEQRARDNDSAARGMLIGIVIASLLGLGVLAWYFLTQRNPEPVPQIIIPESTSPSPQAPPPPPEVNITVPSTQPSQAPASPPEVDNNITIPSPQQSQAPETAPEINNNITVPSASPQSPSSESEAPATDTAPTSPNDTAPTSSPSTAPEQSR